MRGAYLELPSETSPFGRRSETGIVLVDGWSVSVTAYNGELKVVATLDSKERIIVVDESSPYYDYEGVIIFRAAR